MNTRLAAAFTAAALTASGLSIVAAAPAQAVTNVGISAPNVTVRLNACATSRITVSGDWAGDPYNSIDTTITGPTGEWVGGDYWIDDTRPSGTVDVDLCGAYDTPGRYTVTVEAEGYDENYENQTVASSTKTFTFTKVDPRAKSSIVKKAKRTHGKYKWRVPARLFRAGRGYVGRRVAIQAVIAGDWYEIAAQRTKKQGRFGWRFKPNGYTWRYVFAGNSATKPTVSPAFRTPRKGRAGRELPSSPRTLISN